MYNVNDIERSFAEAERLTAELRDQAAEGEKKQEEIRERNFPRMMSFLQDINELCCRFQVRPYISTGIGAYGELHDASSAICFMPGFIEEYRGYEHGDGMLVRNFCMGTTVVGKNGIPFELPSYVRLKNYAKAKGFSREIMRVLDNWDEAEQNMKESLDGILRLNSRERLMALAAERQKLSTIA